MILKDYSKTIFLKKKNSENLIFKTKGKLKNYDLKNIDLNYFKTEKNLSNLSLKNF